ncbi:hypothetical protein B7Y94_01285 [Candidatus Saccharibacteria bacterium 32-49-12]|nr:MAG: hypothetical protein B7Y94_01285 [Candidatus Saccharibacteria bacterium 32-49-12]
MLYHNLSTTETLESLKSSENGLTAREAKRRLDHFGPNSLQIKSDSIWKIISEPFRDVFMLVLFIAAIISFLHNAVFDGVIIIIIMLVSAVIYYVQRFSTDRILRSLQKHSTQRVEVIRDGRSTLVDSDNIVPGDIVRLSEGDKIPADIRIIEADSLRADESVLTGESEPVNKQTTPVGKESKIYERSSMLYQGAFVVSGTAHGVITATGNNTEFGRIAALSRTTADASQSPVQKKIDKLIKQIIIVVSGMAIVAFVLALMRGIELSEAIMFVLALAVSAVPESLPIAISVILVLGMRRMAAKKALVRSMRAIETIGVITTIATDKTGTLTENKLSVQEIWQPNGASDDLLKIIHQSTLTEIKRTRDPLDVALLDYTGSAKKLKITGKSIDTLPFNQAFAMSGNIWKNGHDSTLVVKGAPEKILERSRMTASERRTAEEALAALTAHGYRVIAFAKMPLKRVFGEFEEFREADKMNFAGFVGIADTLRPSARRAIRVAQNAGVTIRMITGDHFETAYHIGRQLGLVDNRDQVFDSRTMDEMTDAQLAKRVALSRVFSRVTPENKYRILRSLKLTEVAAMTGDGVNDVPALSNANVGVAMGSGSQIAKDAGAIILLDDNFASIIRAMKEGRIIFANIRRMLFYLLSTNAGEAITMVTAIAIGMPMPLMPVQILWVNLVTDTSMVIPLGLEPGEKDVMKRRPVDPNAPLLDKHLIIRIILVALAMAALALGLYAIFSAMYSPEYGRTIAFMSLVAMQWANAFNARSSHESVFSRLRVMNKSFYIGLLISIALQLLALVGPLQGLLHVTPVAWIDLTIVSALSIFVIVLVVEVHKIYTRRQIKSLV